MSETALDPRSWRPRPRLDQTFALSCGGEDPNTGGWTTPLSTSRCSWPKGVSTTMGFAGMAALTHEMEDVFELLRQRRGGLERAAIDVLLECLDALEAAVDSIESDGAEAITPEPLIVRLRTLVRDDEAPAESLEAAPAAIEPPADLGELAQGRRV